MIAPRFEWDELLVNPVISSVINGIGISIVIGVITWLALLVLGWESAVFIEFIDIMLIAGMLTSVVLILGLLGVLFLGYKRGYDPDNLVGPIVTTLGDIFGMLFLLFAVGIVEVVI